MTGEWIFAASFIAFFLNFCGYIFILALLKKIRATPLPIIKDKTNLIKELPEFYIIVTFLNEESFLRKKIQNLLNLEYQEGKKHIVLVDGGSSDNSLRIVNEFLAEHKNLKSLQIPGEGKIAQLNAALAIIPENAIVAVSDADALLSPSDILLRSVYYLEQKNISLVGAWGMPDANNALEIECAHWDKQNRLRYMETLSYSATIVTALFYAFPKKIFSRFPDNCIADDVYISFFTHQLPARVIYAPDIEAVELRQTKKVLELFKQKFRKAHAYTTELFRQLHKLPGMKKRVKFLYLFKVFQFFYLPWISIFLIGSTIALILSGNIYLIVFCYLFLFCGISFASFLVAPPPGRTRGGVSFKSAFNTILSFAFINFVLVLNSMSFPFWRQTARYSRIKK